MNNAKVAEDAERPVHQRCFSYLRPWFFYATYKDDLENLILSAGRPCTYVYFLCFPSSVASNRVCPCLRSEAPMPLKESHSVLKKVSKWHQLSSAWLKAERTPAGYAATYMAVVCANNSGLRGAADSGIIVFPTLTRAFLPHANRRSSPGPVESPWHCMLLTIIVPTSDVCLTTCLNDLCGIVMKICCIIVMIFS